MFFNKFINIATKNCNFHTFVGINKRKSTVSKSSEIIVVPNNDENVSFKNELQIVDVHATNIFLHHETLFLFAWIMQLSAKGQINI